jgi:putative restriction endonuclease
MAAITEPALLRASRIKPWADCTDAERLDVHNGLLLSALWDAAFDRGLVSFADDGSVLASPRLGEMECEALGLAKALPLQGLRDAHRANLALNRSRFGFE